MWADNTCDFCAEGLQAFCRHGGQWGDEGVDGGQGEAVRVPQAQGTLVQVTGGWFPGTQEREEGHIWAGGIDKDVTFAEADPDIKRHHRRRLPRQVPPLGPEHHRRRREPRGASRDDQARAR